MTGADSAGATGVVIAKSVPWQNRLPSMNPSTPDKRATGAFLPLLRHHQK
ncbi:MAG TPA: hypothetical protein HPP76_07530 [Desulfuromonadales bacterium]|nr:hypothetical protein [Desulfuromonadales bacterium]